MSLNHTQKIAAGFESTAPYQYITAVQGDSKTRYVNIALINNSQHYIPPSGSTAVLRCEKPDGKKVANSCSISEDGTITVELTRQILAVAGECRCEISLYESEESVLTTLPFVIKVVPSVGEPTEINSVDEYGVLQTLIAEVSGLIDKVESLTPNVPDDGNKSDIAKSILIYDEDHATNYAATAKLISGKPALEYSDAKGAIGSGDPGNTGNSGESEEATNAAAEKANAAAERANAAADKANAAAESVNSALSAANTAVEKANAAADETTAAAERANAAADEANAAAESVNSAITTANTSAEKANTAADKANTAAESVDSAITTANKAADEANTAAERANAAAESANSAIITANIAADEANAAAESVNSAITTANTSAEKANTAAESAEKVNISAVQTDTGADITVTNRQGNETTVHIDTIFAVETWDDVRNSVRLGAGPKLFPVGYEFETLDSDTGNTIVWVVRGHDHHKAANDKLKHTMTLETKCVYSAANNAYKGIVFDAKEALYHAENKLSAGTYNFTVDGQTWYTADNGKTFRFTLTRPVPAGGQIYLDAPHGETISGKTVSTYANPSATDAIESGITVTEGSDGTSLGTTGNAENINHIIRAMHGSSNYAQSAIRQWLNSDAEAGAVWSPVSKFDRPPTWAATDNGFMHGLPAEFLAVVQPAVVPCRTNSVYETDSIDGTEFTTNQTYTVADKFFPLSRPEVYGDWDSESYKDGEILGYYIGLTDAERIKYDIANTARYCWLRSPNADTPDLEWRIRSTDGKIYYNSPYYNTNGVAPACIIA